MSLQLKRTDDIFKLANAAVHNKVGVSTSSEHQGVLEVSKGSSHGGPCWLNLRHVIQISEKLNEASLSPKVALPV